MAPPFFLEPAGENSHFPRLAAATPSSTRNPPCFAPPPVLRHLPLVRPLRFLSASETEAPLHCQMAYQARAILFQ